MSARVPTSLATMPAPLKSRMALKATVARDGSDTPAGTAAGAALRQACLTPAVTEVPVGMMTPNPTWMPSKKPQSPSVWGPLARMRLPRIMTPLALAVRMAAPTALQG